MKNYKNISKKDLIVPNYGIVKPGQEFKFHQAIINPLIVEVKEQKKEEIKQEVKVDKKEEEKIKQSE